MVKVELEYNFYFKMSNEINRSLELEIEFNFGQCRDEIRFETGRPENQARAGDP